MTESTDVVKPTPMLNDDQLTEIKSFDDAVAMLAAAGIEATSVTEYGDGFLVLDKADFVNVPFVIVEYRIVEAAKSDYGAAFVVIRLVSKDGRKAIVTDGSQGIRAQLERLSNRGVTGGLICEKGFVVSEYEYVDDKGDRSPAKTYYIYGL